MSSNNAVDNFLRYINNLKQNPRNDPQPVAEIERTWLNAMNKWPSIFAKVFSDDPAGLAAARQEALERIAQIRLKSENK
jgi:hypothetical protein